MSEGASGGAAPSGAPASGGSAQPDSPTQTSPSSPSSATPSGAASPAAPPPFRVKLSKPVVVDGVEQAVEYDDEEKLRLDIQLAHAARRRITDAARIKKQSDELQAQLKDPARFWDVARAQGHDPTMLAAQLLADQAERRSMTPDQIKALEDRQRADTAEGKLKQFETEAQKVAQQRADDAVWSEFEPKLIAAAEKMQLPNDPQTMDLLARVGMEFANNGVELAPEHVVAEVQRRQATRTMRYLPSAPVPMLAQAFKAMPVEKLMTVLNAAGLFEPVRAAMVAQWRQSRGQPAAAAPPPGTQPARPQPPRDPELGRYITAAEFRRVRTRR